jgi:hypothetical protein
MGTNVALSRGDFLSVPLRSLLVYGGARGALKGRFLVNPLEKPARLVGAGAAWSMGGDACVAPVLFTQSISPMRRKHPPHPLLHSRPDRYEAASETPSQETTRERGARVAWSMSVDVVASVG